MTHKLSIPVDGRRKFRNEDEIGFRHDSGHESEVSAVPAHDLHDEGSLVRVRGRDDAIDGLHDATESGVGPDGHVRSTEVVVDRTDDSNNVKLAVLLDLVIGDQLAFSKLFY